METKKRPHRANGKPHGGARPGAGRPKGSRNTLPTGAVKALKSLNMRAPKDASDEQKEILAETEDRLLDVMRGKVHSSIATPVLKAVVEVREEICGPKTQKIDLTAKMGIAALLDEVAAAEAEAKDVATLAPPVEPSALPEKVEAKGPIIRKAAAVVVETGLTDSEVWGEG